MQGDSHPTVSIVMPVRNGARFLSESLEAVVNQTRPATEILIIDGHSTDETPAIVESFAARDPRVRFLVQPDRGVYDALNFGIQQARSIYIAFASSDDNWTLDKLEVQIGYMEAHPEVEYSVGRARFFIEPGCSIPPGFRTHLLEGEPMVLSLEATVVRQPLIERIGLFHTDYVSAADVEWHARASHMGAVLGEIDHLLVHRRVHDRNTSYYNPDNTREILRALRTAIHAKKDAS